MKSAIKTVTALPGSDKIQRWVDKFNTTKGNEMSSGSDLSSEYNQLYGEINNAEVRKSLEAIRNSGDGTAASMSNYTSNFLHISMILLIEYCIASFQV